MTNKIDIETATPAELEIALHQLAHAANKAEKEWNAAQEEYQVIKDSEDLKRSAIVDAQIAKTNTEKERMADLDPKWHKWYEGLQAARSKANELKVEMHCQNRLFEACRSILSSKNKEWARQ